MKPSRSLRPNHSWLRNFFVVMGANLRAGRGAKQSAERVGARRVLLSNENVYSRRGGGTPNLLFEWCTLAGLLGGALPLEQIRRSALCQSFRAKQNVAMISQDESDGSQLWPWAPSCFPVIQALRPILPANTELQAFLKSPDSSRRSASRNSFPGSSISRLRTSVRELSCRTQVLRSDWHFPFAGYGYQPD